MKALALFLTILFVISCTKYTYVKQERQNYEDYIYLTAKEDGINLKLINKEIFEVNYCELNKDSVKYKINDKKTTTSLDMIEYFSIIYNNRTGLKYFGLSLLPYITAYSMDQDDINIELLKVITFMPLVAYSLGWIFPDEERIYFNNLEKNKNVK